MQMGTRRDICRWGQPSVVLALACAAPVGSAQPRVDPRVVEAIGWYTGVAGRVDDAKARALIDAAATDGDVLARMWVARAYSRGRLGYPRDEAKARAIATLLVDAVRRQAGQGSIEAVFLMGTACDEGLGVREHPPRRSSGSTRPPRRVIRWPSTTSATPTRPAAAWRPTPPLPSRGGPRPPSRATPCRRCAWVRRTSRARAWRVDLAAARRWYGEAAARGNAAATAALQRLGGW